MDTHWYDRLWFHLETAVEDNLDTLLDIRRAFGKAKTREDIERARIAFERWEESRCN